VMRGAKAVGRGIVRGAKWAAGKVKAGAVWVGGKIRAGTRIVLAPLRRRRALARGQGRFPRPTIKDPALEKNYVNALYRPGAKIGNGSTADAIRSELATKLKVGGRIHTQKGEDSIRALERWLARNPAADAGDRAAAQAIIDDLKNALSGK